MRLEIKKELDRTVDAGSNKFSVTVIGEGVSVGGYAVNIFEGNTYHLDSELEDALDNVGIDYDKVRDALEDGASSIEVEHSGYMFGDSSIHKAIEAVLDQLGAIDCRYRWDDKKVYLSFTTMDTVAFSDFRTLLDYTSGMLMMKKIKEA